MTNETFKDIEKLESDLWEAADNLRANSKLTSSDYFGYGGIVPFKQWEKIQSEFVQPSPKAIAMVKDYCTYAYETYGRFPATTDTMILPVWLQVHHLDIEFYEKYMNPELLTETHRRHNELWHK